MKFSYENDALSFQLIKRYKPMQLNIVNPLGDDNFFGWMESQRNAKIIKTSSEEKKGWEFKKW